MQATFYDGLTTRAQPAQAALEAEVLTFTVEGETHAWPLDAIEEEVIGRQVRLALNGAGAARLTLDLRSWRDATAHLSAYRRGRRARQIGMVSALSLVAAGLTAVIFFGLPLAAVPLANNTPPALEAAMGANFRKQVGLAFPDCKGERGQAALQTLADRLDAVTDTPFPIRIRAVEAPMVNAFALPGGEVMVTDDLIELAQSPDELAAVIAHEAAHVERRHVMQAVWRSLGLGLLLDAVVGGGTGAGQQAVLLAGSITSLRYSRRAEVEADAGGQSLLSAAGLSSQGMAPFFLRLAATGEGPEAARVKELLSSHPDTRRRADQSRARGRPGAVAFDPTAWGAIKQTCQGPSGRLERFGI